jgi:hypothetical protein
MYSLYSRDIDDKSIRGLFNIRVLLYNYKL